MLVWKILMAQSPQSHTISNTYHVVADSLREALDRAEAIEQEFANEMAAEEGDTPKPDRAVSGSFLCKLDASDT